MKVHDPNSSSSSGAGAATATARAKQTQDIQQTQDNYSGGSRIGGRGSGDDVQLSDLAQSLDSLKTAVAADSPDHLARVEHISKAYAAGTYKVDAAATAAGVIADGISSTPANS